MGDTKRHDAGAPPEDLSGMPSQPGEGAPPEGMQVREGSGAPKGPASQGQ